MPSSPTPRWSACDWPTPEHRALTARPVALRIRVLAERAAHPAERMIAVTLAGTVIARAAVPVPLIGALAAMLREPARLLLELTAVRTGVSATLFAVVETRRAAGALGVPQAACWRMPRTVAVPIGAFTRSHAERRHPLDLQAEARHQLRHLLVSALAGESTARR